MSGWSVGINILVEDSGARLMIWRNVEEGMGAAR